MATAVNAALHRTLAPAHDADEKFQSKGLSKMPDKETCKKVKADGTQCKLYALEDSDFCRVHQDANPEPDKATDERDDLSGPDFSGDLCREHFPWGWPEDAESAGCAHGNFVRE